MIKSGIPGYPVAGQVWEATATVSRGNVARDLAVRTRTADGINYRLASRGPRRNSGAHYPQGEQSTGKIYFDVTGPSPAIVAMNNGMGGR